MMTKRWSSGLTGWKVNSLKSQIFVKPAFLKKRFFFVLGGRSGRLENADAFLKQSPDHLRSSDTHLLCARIRSEGHCAPGIRGER